MTAPLLQGECTIARMCALAGVSRAGYYRQWAASAPREEATAVRDMVQRVALAEPHYGYRRVAFELRRAGVVVNRKRVLRLMREDNCCACVGGPSRLPRPTRTMAGRW
jgi:transposase InsO family protein